MGGEQKLVDQTDAELWLGPAAAGAAERCGTAGEPLSWESALWPAALRYLRIAASRRPRGTSAPAGSGREDLGLLALELLSGDNSPVAEVGQLGQLVRRVGR
jgi:hypothetical protein